jgi:hypothetical protein
MQFFYVCKGINKLRTSLKQRFYSKKDLGMGIFLAVLTLFLLFLFLMLFFSQTPIFVKIILSVFTLGWSILLGSFWFNTWYDIEDDLLTCRSGLVIKKISISKIRFISKPKKNYSYSYIYMPLALSFSQIVISYNAYDDLSISPADNDEFVNALKSINPNIVIN